MHAYDKISNAFINKHETKRAIEELKKWMVEAEKAVAAAQFHQSASADTE